MRKFFIPVAGALMAVSAATAQRYVGGDISTLPDMEKAGSQYKDVDGKPIAELLPWLHDQGMNAMRVRLFVNPKKYKELHQNDTNADTKYDPNASQDLEYITPLCRKIVNSGMKLLLDFHYSDTWADPAKQWTPIDWEGLTDEQLYQKIYDYTKEVLTTLKAAGVTPAFIQPGNEISFGMLWGKLGDSNPKKTLMGNSANWDRLGKLLTQAIKACREECPDAKIILHTERVADTAVLANFYREMQRMNIDYDIIGLSYYPYFHGRISVLDSALATMQAGFPGKNIMLVETGYPLKWAVPGTTHDTTAVWPLTEAGQAKFATDVVNTLLKYKNADGLFWWWMDYNAKGTSLSDWYNAPLFDSETGKATAALKALCAFGESSGIDAVEADKKNPEGRWYNLQGVPVEQPTEPGLYISPDRRVIKY